MPLPDIDFRFYATLLDGFTDYLNSDLIWERYWGWSVDPPHTPDEFRERQFRSFIDRINRVPFDSEAADRGTAFNEIVDCLIERRKPAKGFAVEKVYDPADSSRLIAVTAEYKERLYRFDIALLREFAAYYKGALTQQYVKAVLPTGLGNVELYGFIDELMPLSVHDIKTTGAYSVGKFKSHWQHIVYPYCLMQNGSDVRAFEYNVAEIDRYGRWATYTETYEFEPDRDVPRLRRQCEELITFLVENRELITDKKIFNQL